jgi:integrase
MVRAAFGHLIATAGDVPVDELTVGHLEAAREAMKATCSRKTVNQHLGRITRGVRWWVQKRMIPLPVGAELRGVEKLPAYRSGAKEYDPVGPVEWGRVEPVVGGLVEPWKSLTLLLWLSGLRPGEACGMLREWVTPGGAGDDCYVVDFGLVHKGGWRGKPKRVLLGPKASGVLRPWLESADLRGRAEVFCTDYFRDKATPATAYAYAAAVRRACDRLGVPRWHPSQLRHSYATRVRAALGLEAAQQALGHAKADVTQIYAERDERLASRVARELG